MTPLTFREQCSYHWLVNACDYTRAEAMQRIHSERLAVMVEANRASFRTQDYAKRRDAALKHTRAHEVSLRIHADERARA